MQPIETSVPHALTRLHVYVWGLHVFSLRGFQVFPHSPAGQANAELPVRVGVSESEIGVLGWMGGWKDSVATLDCKLSGLSTDFTLELIQTQLPV